MRKLIIIIQVCLLPFLLGAQNVAISADGSNPDASAMLDVKSNNKGLLIPRMSLAERSAILSPATGLLVYQHDDEKGFYYNQGSPTSPEWTILFTGQYGEPAVSLIQVMRSFNQSEPLDNLPSALSVSVRPNPSSSYFLLTTALLTTAVTEQNTSIQLRVINMSGQVVELKENIQPGQTVTIGDRYIPGIYFVETKQENRSKLLKLIKQ